MNNYTIRVELNEPTPNMHIELLYIMLENGFSRSVVCEKGNTYALPSNEFTYVGTENIRSLTDRIANLINSFSHDPAVFISRSEERCWSGLRSINLS